MRALRTLVPALLMCLGLSGCATLVTPPTVAPGAPSTSPAEAVQAWARVLDRFVDERGEVDFVALSEDRADLDRYVRYVAHTPPEAIANESERLAELINSYNALSMFNVIESGIPATHAGLNKLIFFVQRKMIVGGRALSLYAFENELIRPLARALGLPEVHFALNCSARSCPVLPRVPFDGKRLADRLKQEAREFFSRPENFRFDATTHTVWLSEIMDFYTEDFVPAHGNTLVAYAIQYAPHAVPVDAKVRFTPYDWSVANSRHAH